MLRGVAFAGRLFLFWTGFVLDGFILDEDRPDHEDRPYHTGLEAKLAARVTPTLEALGYELVRVAVIGRERPTVQIMADRADGARFGIEDCEALSRTLGAALDVEDPLPGAWTLEVSSPGIDRPLTRAKDWNRYAGHLARVEMAVAQEGRKRFVGVVLGADRETARLRLDDGSEIALPRAEIRRAKLVLTEALLAAEADPPLN